MAGCYVSWILFWLNVILAECYFSWMLFWLDVILAGCYFSWILFWLNVILTGCYFGWTFIWLDVILRQVACATAQVLHPASRPSRHPHSRAYHRHLIGRAIMRSVGQEY